MSPPANPEVRVYLFTYRRPDTLPRALESLLAQTYTNWVCELHNDDPNDDSARQLVKTINDPRIYYVHHERNLGALASFNLAFRIVPERFMSILEDDNWWEPDLLATLLHEMTRRPDVHIAWANMWLWRETDSKVWEQIGSIWPISMPQEAIEFVSPEPRQVCGALHSNGAMLARISGRTMFASPKELPFFAIESVRERAYPGRLLLVTRPLANFAITVDSARGESADENMQIHVLLAVTFLTYANVSGEFYRRMWKACRGSLGHRHRSLLVAAILAGRLGKVLKSARLGDLTLVIAWALRHPIRFSTLFHAQDRFPEVLAFLDAASSARVSEWENQTGAERLLSTPSTHSQ